MASLSGRISGTSMGEIWKLVSRLCCDVSSEYSSTFSPSLGVLRIETLVSIGDIGLMRRI